MYRLHRTFIPNCPDPYLSANENLRSPRIISNIWLRKRKPSSRVWKRNRRYEDWKRQNETNKDLRILIVTIFSKFNNNSPENRFWIPFKKFFFSSFPIPIMWIDHRLERSNCIYSERVCHVPCVVCLPAAEVGNGDARTLNSFEIVPDTSLL